MSSFLVDSRTLLAVRETLGRLHDQLLGMHITAHRYDGVLGGRVLEGELQQFCGRWHWGLEQIGGQTADMMSRLTGAAAAYERIEDRITAGGSHRRHPPGSGTGSGTTTVGPTGGAPLTGRGERRPPSRSGSGTTVIG